MSSLCRFPPLWQPGEMLQQLTRPSKVTACVLMFFCVTTLNREVLWPELVLSVWCISIICGCCTVFVKNEICFTVSVVVIQHTIMVTTPYLGVDKNKLVWFNLWNIVGYEWEQNRKLSATDMKQSIKSSKSLPQNSNPVIRYPISSICSAEGTCQCEWIFSECHKFLGIHSH